MGQVKPVLTRLTGPSKHERGSGEVARRDELLRVADCRRSTTAPVIDDVSPVRVPVRKEARQGPPVRARVLEEPPQTLASGLRDASAAVHAGDHRCLGARFTFPQPASRDAWHSNIPHVPIGLAPNMFTTLPNVPGSQATNATAINDAGDIVGIYLSGGVQHGFLLSGGVFHTIDFPGATLNQVFGLNNAGQIVGETADSSFLCSGGVYTLINVPGVVGTAARAINNSGRSRRFIRFRRRPCTRVLAFRWDIHDDRFSRCSRHLRLGHQ